jgi:hypothetical protein
MQLTEEQLAQAIAGLDEQARSRVASLIPEQAARGFAATLIRRSPWRRRMDASDRLDAVTEAIAGAGDRGITYGSLGRKLRMPAAEMRQALEIAIESGLIEVDLDEPTNGRGRPATRFRRVVRRRFSSQPSQTQGL